MAVCLIVAPDAAARERVARGVEAGFDLVRGVGPGEDLVIALERERPDLVLVAADDDGSGMPAWIATLDTVRTTAPDVAVLVVGGPSDEHRVAGQALDRGAKGFLRAGEETGPRPFSARGRRPATTELSRRELDVLLGMCEGLSNSEIAASLTLAEDTVKTHARRLFRKLGAGDRADAVARGFRQGILH
ncbi:response regulator transcription factor [Actinomycetospora soli]|uniref:response regulator transcription factor n=1 Tax=Actinomycetospora soli TaxID=2893887 RepID=UPI001E511C0C|nr:response regulator transcription factor [Actinomycetospora soli]MCD2188378.1 response regulator transcription factor [Actinomycetospora soli]